jgi:predicted RND superfamily exporter protein
MQQPTFFARRALVILVVVFFLVPFALRGARMALSGMKNDVKDWLPHDLDETRDLEEFRRYFLSEQFVLVSWDGCYGDETDERYKLFLAKLVPQVPPSQQAAEAGQDVAGEPQGVAAHGARGTDRSGEASSPAEDGMGVVRPTRYLEHDEQFIGNRLGLYFAGDWYENWGLRGEKWLRGVREGTRDECWYFLTPDGDLFRWDGVDAPLAALSRWVARKWAPRPVEGTLVFSFGPQDGAWYHADPRRLRARLFKTVTTGPDVLASLTCAGGELDATREETGESNYREAMRRLEGTLFGPPDPQTGKRTTCIVLTLTEAARRNLHLVLGRGLLGKPRGQLYEIASESNIAEHELRMGGPPVDNVAIDEEGSITLVRLVGYSAVLGVMLSLLCFRSLTATIMILFVGAISAVMSLAMVWWLGSSVDAIMMSMPSLVYVLGLSGAAHILNYYYDAVEQHGHAGAPERAIAHGWRPAMLCNVTTALGLISLVTSELVPIRKFGLFSALGVLATLTVLFTYLPSALEIWPQTPRRKPTTHQPGWLDRSLSDFWSVLGGWIIRHHTLTAVVCTLVIAAFGLGLVRMRTSVNLLNMFHAQAKIIQDYQWLETHLGQLVPMEVVLRVPPAQQRPSNTELRALQEELAAPDTPAERKQQIAQRLAESQFQLSFLERMELAARVQQVIEREFGPEGRDVIGRAISAATFVRPLPEIGGSTSAYLKRSTTSGRLQAHRDDFLHSDYLRLTDDDQTELWRVSLRVGATRGVDYGAFVSDLQQTVEPVIAAHRQRETILRTLLRAKQQTSQEETQVVGSRVLVLGVPPAGNAEAAGSTQAHGTAPAVSKRATRGTHEPVDQPRIYAQTLAELLLASRLKLDLVPADASQLPQTVAARLESYDGIVLAGPVSGLDLAELRSRHPLVLDARYEPFRPGSGQLTAWQTDPTRVAAVYTGVVPIVYKAQRMLLDSLIESTFWSVVTITPLLMWIARSLTAGAVAMLPNVLPILVVFGGMGWLGVDVDVGSMMTASIALGVAVDDTIHYLNWFREELDRLGDRKKAILAAYKHCATPTLQAAVISGLGLSIFALSTFTPTQRFGVLMLVILWLGAIAELIYFPALLAGPLGRVFRPRRQAAQQPAAAPVASDEPKPLPVPRLAVVGPEDLAEAEEQAASAPSAAPGTPNTSGPAVPHRHLRADAPHRRH